MIKIVCKTKCPFNKECTATAPDKDTIPKKCILDGTITVDFREVGVSSVESAVKDVLLEDFSNSVKKTVEYYIKEHDFKKAEMLQALAYYMTKASLEMLREGFEKEGEKNDNQST